MYRADLLGEGGFTRKVALKVLNADMVGVEDVAHRLRDEARLLGLLRHRAIVQVDGLVLLNDRWTVVMEYIEGSDLQRLLRASGPMPLGCALEVISEVASALDIAYATPGPNGVPLHLLHRDIKPPNILLTAAGEIKVLDFGIARAEFSGREAQTKSVLYGSIGYMAPERMEFEELPAGDVYALGTVLFELLDGAPLGKSSINPQKHAAHIDASLQRLWKKIPAVPAEFPELLRSMLAYEPDERPTAREVERRCRALRSQATDPWLRDWAEKVLPPLLVAPVESKIDDFSGSIVVERTTQPDAQLAATPQPGASGRVATRPPPPPPNSARPKKGRSWLSTLFWGCLLFVFVCVLAVTLLGGTAVAGVFAILMTLLSPGESPAPVDTGGTISEYEDLADDLQDLENLGELLGGGGGVPPWVVASPLVEPWASMQLPLGQGVVGFCDGTTVMIYESERDSAKVRERWGSYFEGMGYKQTYNAGIQGGYTTTYQAADSSMYTVTIMDVMGMMMVTVTKSM